MNQLNSLLINSTQQAGPSASAGIDVVKSARWVRQPLPRHVQHQFSVEAASLLLHYNSLLANIGTQHCLQSTPGPNMEPQQCDSTYQ